MHKFIKKIKNNEEKPYVIKNFLNSNEIREFIDLYQKLPIEVNNQRQKIVKKNGQRNCFLIYKRFTLKN